MIPRLLDIIALSGLAILVSFLSGTGQLTMLIHPRFQWLVSFASALLLLASFWLLFRGHLLRRDRSHILSSLLIIGVVFMFPFVPLQSLSSATALNRGVGDRAPSRDEALMLEALNTPPLERNMSKWVRLLAHQSPDQYLGEEVSLEAMVVKIPSLPPNTVMLTRFLVACCVADARPFGLLAVFPEGFEVENDEWVRVRGEIVMGEYEGSERGVVQATSVEVITQPDDPYEFQY